MARQEIEDFVRNLVAEIEAAEAAGVAGTEAIADHLNANSVTTCKGRSWTGCQVPPKPWCEAVPLGWLTPLLEAFGLRYYNTVNRPVIWRAFCMARVRQHVFRIERGSAP